MSGRCRTCMHPERDAIGRGLVTGTPLRTLEERYGISRSSLARHKDNCLAQTVQRAAEEREAADLEHGGDLLRAWEGFQRLVGVVDPDQQSALRLELPNGSRIVSLPGTPDNIRGFSGPSLIVVDEAAYCEDQLFFAASPMLATSGGRMVAMTTPNGQRGYFHREWHNGSDRWHRFQVTAHECSRISPEFLEQERASMPERYFRQEYLCEFLDTDDQAFASALVDAAFTSDVRPLFTPGELDNAA